MSTHREDPFAIPDTDGEYTAQFQGQFAPSVAELRAHVDDPAVADNYPALLAKDPDEQPGWLAVTWDLINADPALLMVLLNAVAVATSFLVAVLIARIVL